jgi:predicted ATPase/DNA-binding CsgD family transcriptional regulator
MSSDGTSHLVEPLTGREQDVLDLLAQGKSNRELAEALVLSLNTVKWYARQVYAKLGVANREEAVARARALRLLADEASARPRHNLPLQLTSFVGRERELAEVRRLLSASRLVTLTGAGGCGKTRLALEAARTSLDHYPDGVWTVQLASLSDAALVPQAVAAVFDVRESEDRSLVSLLQSYLRNRKLLLLLDNCEHLVEAAAQLAEALLTHCPKLQILATSREPLAISGEAVWLVPALALPQLGERPRPETLMNSDAIRLFVERAAAALPTFSLSEENAPAVEQVCRRLDGIPLALELAAARVKLLRVEQIADRLDDRFRLLAGGSRTALPRHQTLQALIEWSYELLAPAEQRMLRYLSVFAGGFTLDAVEAICATDEAGDTLALLAQLVNKSLLVAERERGRETRYHLLETIRHYALEKMQPAGEAGRVRARHLHFFLRLAETAEPLLHSGEQLVWLDRLEAEHDNLRAALAWSLEEEPGHVESGVRLATALVPFWIVHAHLWEGRRWLDPALESRENVTLPVRAQLLCHAGRLWTEQWVTDPTALLEESLDLYRQLGDKAGMGRSLCWLGWCALRFRQDAAAAQSRWEEGLALAEQVDDRPLLTWLHHGLAWNAVGKGVDDLAMELSARGLALAQKSGDHREKLRQLYILGRIAKEQRDYGRAATFFHETLALVRELNDKADEASILNALGETARFDGAYEQAAGYYHESLALYQELDSPGGTSTVLHNLGLLALAQGNGLRARSLFRESLALDRGVKWSKAHLWNVWGFARLALAAGQPRRAARLLAAAGPYINTPDTGPVDRDDYARDVTVARAQLGESGFAVAWAEGLALSLDEAVALALATSNDTP